MGLLDAISNSSEEYSKGLLDAANEPKKKKKKKSSATSGGPAHTGLSGGADDHAPFYKNTATSGGPAHSGLSGSARPHYNSATGQYDTVTNQRQYDLWRAAAARAAELRRQNALREARIRTRRLSNEESTSSILGFRDQQPASFVDSIISIPEQDKPKLDKAKPPLPFEQERVEFEKVTDSTDAVSFGEDQAGFIEENLAIEGEDTEGGALDTEVPKPVQKYLDLLEMYRNQRSPQISDLLGGGKKIDASDSSSLFPSMSDPEMPGFGMADPFPYFLMEGPGGKLHIKDISEVLDHYLLQVQDDPRDAAALALSLAKINGDTSYENDLNERMVRTGGGLALRWSDKDDSAFLSALQRASREQQNLVENGNYQPLDKLLGNMATRGFGAEAAETRQDRDGDGKLDGPGVPQAIGLLPPGKYAGYAIDQEQMGNLDVIAQVGRTMGMSERDIGIAIITAITESNIRNVDHGDRDSLGIFQQRPSQGWGTAVQVQDPRYASQKFFESLKKLKNRDSMSMGEAAQAVQRSAHPERYANNIGVAAAILGPQHLRKNSAPIEMVGNVQPHVRAAAEEISGAFGIDNIGGKAESGHIPGSFHYSGRAIDVMLEGSRDGKAIAEYAVRNAKRMGAIEVIHNGQYWTPDGGWEPYTGDNPHTGHVHVSFAKGGGGGGKFSAFEPMPGTGAAGGTGGTGGTSGGTAVDSGAYGTAQVQYSDPTKIGGVADSVAEAKIGRELDEDEISDVVERLHLAEQEFANDSAAGLSATYPDLQGIIEAYIEEKLSEEQEMQLEGELAMAAFRMLSGGGFGG